MHSPLRLGQPLPPRDTVGTDSGHRSLEHSAFAGPMPAPRSRSGPSASTGPGRAGRRRGLLMLLLVLGCSLGAVPAWGGPDPFAENDYVNCPVHLRLEALEDLEVRVVPDSDDYEVSWRPLSRGEVPDGGFTASVTAMLQLGEAQYRQSARLGAGSIVFPGIAGQALDGEVWLTLTDRDHVIGHTVTRKVPPSLPRPRFEAPFRFEGSEVRDTRGRVYYVGFNHNFANGYVDTGRSEPEPSRLRIGVRHGGTYDPEDAGFDHFRLRMERMDTDRNRVDLLGYDAKMVDADPLYAGKVLVLGQMNDPDIADPGSSRFSTMLRTRRLADPAPAAWDPAAPTASYWGSDRTPPIISAQAGAATSPHPISFMSLAPPSTRRLHAPLPDAIYDLPPDLLSTDGHYFLTAWAANARNEPISQTCTLHLYALQLLGGQRLYTNVWGFDSATGNDRIDKAANHVGPGRAMELRLIGEECRPTVNGVTVPALNPTNDAPNSGLAPRPALQSSLLAANPPLVAAGYNQTCRLQTGTGQLACNLDDMEYQTYYDSFFRLAARAAPSATFKSVAIGHWHACGIKASDSTIQCWGVNHPSINNRDGHTALGLGAVKALDVGRYHTCVIKSDNTAACWGWNGFSQVSDTPTDTFVHISTGSFHNCGLTTAGNLVCWGRNTSGQSTVPGTVRQRTRAVSASFDHTCALLTTGAVQCWGNNEYGKATPDASERFTAVDTGRYHTCALKTDETILCWGDDRYGQTSQPPTGGRWRSIDAGYVHTCGVRKDNRVECWRKTDSVNPPAYKQLVAGYLSTCGIRNADSQLQCWGGLSQFEGSASTLVDGRGVYPAAFKSVSMSRAAICGILTNDRRACFTKSNTASMPGSSDTYSGISVAGSTSTSYGCGILKTTDSNNDTVRCWGDNTDTGESLAVPSDLGTVSAVSAGQAHACVIRKTADSNDDTVRCWGTNTGSGGSLAVPSDLGTVSAVSAGQAHVCVIRKTADSNDDTVRCWGTNTGSGGSLAVPSDLGTVKEVAAAPYRSHTCAVKSNDEIHCWGDALGVSPATSMPAGLTGSNVTIGNYHICALKTSDSKPACWGSDASKEVSGPNSNSPAQWSN